MIRMLYRALMWLHPPAFRRAFADEMLWIFDETRGTSAVWLLFADGLVSLARQWLLRSGVWKLALAGAGGLVQVTLGGLVFVIWRQLSPTGHSLPEPRVPSDDMMRLIYMAVGVGAGVVMSVLTLTLWLRGFTARRIHHDA